MPHQASQPQLFPKVSGIHVPHLGRRQEALHFDWKMCCLLPLSHRVHKEECFLFKGFFLNHLPPNIRTHLMREDISDPRKLAAKADKIWQSSSARSVNAVSATSPVPPGYGDSINALCQGPQPCPASSVAPRPAPHASHPPSSSTTFDLCWYHCKHGDQAQHCRAPCAWVQGN